VYPSLFLQSAIGQFTPSKWWCMLGKHTPNRKSHSHTTYTVYCQMHLFMKLRPASSVAI